MTEHGTATYTLGQYNEVLVAVTRVLPRGLEGTDPKILIRLLQKSGGVLSQKLAEVFRSMLQPCVATGEVFRLMIDGDKNASELVALAKYDWFNDWITDDHLPIKPHAPIEKVIEYVKFDRHPESEEVLAEFARRGLQRPAYEDALYFGLPYNYPDEQRRAPLVWLHEPVEVSDDNRYVLVSYGYDCGRSLRLYWFGRRWGRTCVFPAVRKQLQLLEP